MPHVQKNKTGNRNSAVTNSVKILKVVHIQKIFFKKEKSLDSQVNPVAWAYWLSLNNTRESIGTFALEILFIF